MSLKPLLLRIYRAGIVLTLIWLVYQQARWFDSQRPPVFKLKTARKYFPLANRVQLRNPETGLHFVLDARGDVLGCLLKTSPQTDHIIGYSGPSDVLVAMDRRGAVLGVELLRSGDTEEYLNKIRTQTNFFGRFAGWRPSEETIPKVEAVSGATLTSFAVAESLQERLAGAAPSLRFPEAVTLSEITNLFPNAARFVTDKARLKVIDVDGRLLGFVVRTSPQADNVSGYRGPSECLVALQPDGRTVAAFHIRNSYDTDSYVDAVRRAEAFTKLFVGRPIDELADFRFQKIDAVSGATQTAKAVADGMQRRFAAELRAAPAPWQPKPRDYGLGAVLLGSAVLAFSRLRSHRWLRFSWQLLLVGYVGLINHDVLSLALLGGWGANGLALKTAPGLVLLAVVALVIPWITRRQIYCHQICPHGAAQQIIGALGHKRWTLPNTVSRWLEFLPTLLLGVALLILVCGFGFNLAKIEAFDAWSWRTATTAALVIAAIGLVASFFVPQAYCRFGCPTGALLNFLRSGGHSDRFGRRDWTAFGFLGLAIAAAIAARAVPRHEPPAPPTTFTGRAMGTTWSVKIRDEVGDTEGLQKTLTREFAWAESLTSHWRTNTDISEFNRTATTDPVALPWPVLTLARKSAQISRESEGAYDITVGPLVRLWGFGPGPKRTEPPSDSEIAAAHQVVGWEKLEVLDGMLRKKLPTVEVDLSSIAEGWSVDHIAQTLQRRGFTDFLVEAGGEIRARGSWTIAIEHPPRTCVISNEALATSGTYRQNFKSAGQQYSHLIDPRTGRPATHNTVSVSVRHPDCAEADAWSTALNVLGFEKGGPLAERLKLAAQFVVVRDDDKLEVRETSAWRKPG